MSISKLCPIYLGCLYTCKRAVDSEGSTLDFLLTAKRFFPKAMSATHTQEPRVINVNKNAAYPKAIHELKAKQDLPQKVEL